ncbi:Piwi-domain-containing protein [Auriculariales sp. MPI-PUGE-AT-0066]|nr:Piwi-domain-containing protein [Auriculariales sp. MPI-PUGE-AT-0066]
MSKQGPFGLAGELVRAGQQSSLHRRAGYGTLGQAFTAYANNFQLRRAPDKPFFHFDVIVTYADGRQKEVPKHLYRRIVDNLQIRDPRFHPRGSFDGRANLFSTHNIGVEPNKPASFYASADSDSQQNQFMVTLKLVKIIDVLALVRAVLNNTLDSDANAAMKAFSDLSMGMTVLNTIVQTISREYIGGKEGKAGKYITLFKPDRPFTINSEFLDLYHGWHQKVKAMYQAMAVTVDVAYGLVYRPDTLDRLVYEFLRAIFPRDVRDVGPALAATNRTFRGKADKFVRGLEILLTYSVKPGRRQHSKRIKGLSPTSARDTMFNDGDGRQISVYHHYRQAYNIDLRYPDAMCVLIGSKGAVYPLEVLRATPGQQYRSEVPAEVTREMVRISSDGGPQQRQQTIRRAVQTLQYNESDFIRKSGMEVSNDLMKLRGRLLDRPKLVMGRSMMHVPKPDSTWNMPGRQFVDPAPIGAWGIIFLEPGGHAANQGNRRIIEDLGKELTAKFNDIGHSGAPPDLPRQPVSRPIIVWGQQGGNVRGFMNDVHRVASSVQGGPPLTLIIAVMRRPSDDDLINFKWLGDVGIGVPTQVVDLYKIHKGIKDDYLHNVCLKINLKLGGINWYLPRDVLPGWEPQANRYHSTMVIGADVSHPPPNNTTSPSIVGVVASVDPQLTKYAGDIALQMGGRRVETIVDLERVLTPLLIRRRLGFKPKSLESDMPPAQRAMNLRNFWPELVFIFRDGVGEQQYASVTEIELEAVKRSMLAAQHHCNEQDAPPSRYTFVVVTKHHHQRFFPVDSLDGDKTGNCKPGSVFDDGVAHPVLFDYYLQSQAAIKGTARPAHYVVTRNEIPHMNADNMQAFSYNLCYIYERATKSVSIPAPVYYADLICRRAKFMFPPGYDPSDAGSLMNDDEEDILRVMKGRFGPLHPVHHQKMWFV